MLTPARSNDFVVLYVSDEMLPSNRNVFGADDEDDPTLEVLLPEVSAPVFPIFVAGAGFVLLEPFVAESCEDCLIAETVPDVSCNDEWDPGAFEADTVSWAAGG